MMPHINVKQLARPELMIVLLMVLLVGMLIIPMPTWLIDILIALNMGIAALVFVGSFYITSITALSSFPSILLLTTVFRLALSITTTRMVLTQADAGRIVSGFGEFVLGGDLVVGFTVFAIITIVQFLVITKGSERVAEVCGRFSLDGLPGKQMSIDGDLRANVLNGEQAAERRKQLERESQLYGALDGAIKFVKNDAMASILIVFVNFLGGIAIGVYRHGLPFDQALDTYTLLTVGDGMVAQIPALLISVAAGFVVTRVNGDTENLGKTILAQLGGNGKVLLTVAVLLVLIGLLPGFPLVVFGGVALALIFFCLRQPGGWRAALAADGPATAAASPASAKGKGTASAGTTTPPGTDSEVGNLMPETVALSLLLPAGREEWIAEQDVAVRLEREMFLRLGIKLPAIAVRATEGVAPDRAIVLVNEVNAGAIGVAFGRHKLITGLESVLACGAELIDLSDGSDRSQWITSEALAGLAGKIECTAMTDIDEITDRFCVICARHVAEVFGIQETKNLLDQLETQFPELVKETLRNAPLQRIANVLQRLVRERISVRNLKNILEAIAQWAPKERDNIMLVEHVRSALGRYITEKFSRGKFLHALLLSPQVEESVRRGIQQSAGGSFLKMNRDDGEKLLELLAAGLREIYMPQEDVVVLTSADTRRFVKYAIENQFPKLDVIAYEEITDQSRISVLRTI